MADKPRYPPDPRTWKPPPPPSAMVPRRHHVKTTVCGTARRGHTVTTDWDEVNCPDCLKQAPYRRR
jgi:hypothetical protein